MHANRSSLLIFVCILSSVFGLKKVPCELSDDLCIYEASKMLFNSVITGTTEVKINSSDPLHRDVIQAVLSTLNYTLTDVYMHGMKDCVLQELKINMQQLTSYYYLICPRLTITGHYLSIGEIASMYVEGEGQFKIIFDEYHIGILGKMETYSDAEGELHTKTRSFELVVLEVRKGVIYDFDNLFYGDLEKSKSMHKFLNEHWKEVNTATQMPMLYSFMGKFVENINGYLNYISIDNLFYKYL